MNPLGLPAERFLVAENSAGQLLGFGQLQQQPDKSSVQFLELRTLIVRDDVRYYYLLVLHPWLASAPVHSVTCRLVILMRV